MAGQIDITGGFITRTVPATLGSPYAQEPVRQKDLVADGPSFKSYEVQGDKVVLN